VTDCVCNFSSFEAVFEASLVLHNKTKPGNIPDLNRGQPQSLPLAFPIPH